MLIVLTAEKRIWCSGIGLTILEYSRIVYYSELPIPTYNLIVGFRRPLQFMSSKNLLACSCIVVIKGGTNLTIIATVAVLHSMHLLDLTSDLQQYPVT